MTFPKNLSTHLDTNISYLKEFLPIGTSFDLITRTLYFGKTKAYWIGINGFCRNEILQQIFSDLQNPIFTRDDIVENLPLFVSSKIGYSQAQLCDDWDSLIRNLLSGPSLLFLDGFSTALIIDVRSYPARGISEPDTEKVIKGARDGFVETLLFNANLIRRRIRNPKLTFQVMQIGSDSKTDVAISYISGISDPALIQNIQERLSSLQTNALTMGTKSLEELLIKKRWFHPLPGIQVTERPDVACSYLLEGYVLLLIDNSPSAMILPCSIFQFTQSPDDYYRTPAVGTYFRFIRFLCIPVSLFLMPVLLLFSSQKTGFLYMFIYVLAVEFILDLFKYSTANVSSRFSGSLSLIGGLIIGDTAIQLNWASTEVLFYAAVTLLTTTSLSNLDFSDGLRVYRIFLILFTGISSLLGNLFGFSGGPIGFLIGTLLILLSMLTTPSLPGYSYLWPAFPFQWKPLKTLLFRYSTYKAQPTKIWKHK